MRLSADLRAARISARSSSMSDESRHERELGGQLLASVSRSFYLTLKALPAGLREPLSLAYLLARTADTLADTVTVPAATRLECLRLYESCAQGAASASESGELSARIAREFAPLQSDAAERRLMERFAGALAWLGIMRPGPLRAIRGVLHHIIHGQMLDIERFPADGRLRSLPDAAALEEYTWLVAGCVGEFWTDMCATESPGALEADMSLDEMRKWGASFGKGLQLVNILRDVGEDLRDGRCYLPGVLKDGSADVAALRAAWDHWAGICEKHLESGLPYLRHVADGKLRYATALPLLLAARTLAKMRAASWDEVLRGVKVSRLDVAMILAEAAVSCRQPDKLERLYRKLGAV
ncbi:MAG TPA: farnesyl-diphosphate farnesyltransferase [Verrucomicrobiales bacterium]|nr:farnesyl-diphosphate farnesyltransferase [Verrucomicrobiales bacterium]